MWRIAKKSTHPFSVLFPLILFPGLAQSQKPAISARGGVVNAASFQAPISSGGWVTITGTNLAPKTRTWEASEIVNGRLPTSLDGVSVTINNRPAFVYFISPTQINVQAPDDTVTGPVQVAVTTREGGRSDPATVEFRRTAPALFTLPAENGRYAAAVHADGAVVGRAGLIAGLSTRTASPGGILLFFGTGFGDTTPLVRAGEVVSEAVKLNEQVTARIGGATAKVLYAGLVSAGLYQFNIEVPEVTNGDKSVELTVGSTRAQNQPMITVQNVRPDIDSFRGNTVSPGEELLLSITGTNLAAVNKIEVEPPDDIEVSDIQGTATSLTARLRVGALAALGERPLYVSGPDGRSTETTWKLNISTFRISNLRVGTITNPGSALTIPITVDYTDPTGAVSSGKLDVRRSLVFVSRGGSWQFVGGSQTVEPLGRTPGAVAGTMSFELVFSGISGTTGGNFSVRMKAADGRWSDTFYRDF